MNRHYAIKCTHCAAPLDILGGGRVQTITCHYCHSVLDMNDHYKVLSQFNAVKRPKLPFSIGMHGTIKGVSWTIIGLVQYRTNDPSDMPWVELSLFSPTHGYSWLIYEYDKPHIHFAKRVRDFDLFSWMGEKPKSLFYRKGHYLQREPLYFCFISYVEGELTWVAQKNDRFMVWDYSGVQFQALSIEENSGELEVYHSQRLDKKRLFHAFGVTDAKEKHIPSSEEKSDVIPDNTISVSNKTTSENDALPKTNVKPFFLLFAMVIILILGSFFYRDTLLQTSFKNNFETNITIKSSAFLTAITLDGYKGKQEHLHLFLYQDNKMLFSLDERKAIFPDKTVKPSWTPSSFSATAYVKLEQGTYHLIVKKSNPNNAVTLTIEQHIIRLPYLMALLCLFLLWGIFRYSGLRGGIVAIMLFAGYGALLVFGAEVMIIIFIIGLFFVSSLFPTKSSYNSINDWDDDDWEDWDD